MILKQQILSLLATLRGHRQSTPQDIIVLLHGIGQNALDMKAMEYRLRASGYTVANLSYPSRKHDVETLAHKLHALLQKRGIWDNAGQVHFVTHSMGGLVTRYYLDSYKETIPPEKLGRVVMLAPPNRGSEVADFLQRFAGYRWFFGPAGQDLTTAAHASLTHVPYYELGIISGSAGGLYPVANLLMPGGAKAHDGRVSIASTLLPGITDHIVVHATHSLIPWRKDVHGYITRFLKTGSFQQNADHHA